MLRAMRWLCLALIIGCAGCHSRDVSSAPKPPKLPWYDAAPLSEALRPGVSRAAKEALGLKALEDLPLYELKVTFGEDLRTFSLEQTVWFTNRESTPLDDLVFRLFANARKGPDERPPLVLVSGQCPDVECTSHWDARSVLWIRPATPIAPGGRIKVRYVFDGRLEAIRPDRTKMLTQAVEGMMRMAGHGKQGDYGLLAFGDGIASMGDFYAVLSPRRQGKWEDKEESSLGDLGATSGMSHVKLEVDMPVGTQIATTGIVANKKTPIPAQGLPTRLQAEVVAPLIRNFGLLLSKRFEMKSRRVGGVEVRSWYVHEEQGVGEAVLKHAGDSFAVFQRRFGYYPYVDLDVVEAPLVGGAGGVEFSGLVTIASMFYQPLAGGGMLGELLQGLSGVGGAGSVDSKGALGAAVTAPMVEFVTAHEVAHQWWHGIVGSDAREHPFVDEALAQYSAILYLEDRHGVERARRELERQVVANYHMMRLQGQPDRRADQSAAAFENEIAYAGIVYGKAPGFFPALRKTIGKQRFDAGLVAYVLAHRFREAVPADLVRTFSERGSDPVVANLARHWFEETHGDVDLGKGNLLSLVGQWNDQWGTTAAGDLPKMFEQITGALTEDQLKDMQESLAEFEYLLRKPPKRPPPPARQSRPRKAP